MSLKLAFVLSLTLSTVSNPQPSKTERAPAPLAEMNTTVHPKQSAVPRPPQAMILSRPQLHHVVSPIQAVPPTIPSPLEDHALERWLASSRILSAHKHANPYPQTFQLMLYLSERPTAPVSNPLSPTPLPSQPVSRMLLPFLATSTFSTSCRVQEAIVSR